jgi:DNA-binding response OmpR family regulator
VLIVEDEPAIRRMVDLVLREMGLETISVADAETAEEVAGRQNPDFVITDVRLPGKDGIELARSLRHQPGMASVPIILMSAYGEPAGHGATSFLRKPFDIDTLVEHVNDCIDQRRSGRDDNGR